MNLKGSLVPTPPDLEQAINTVYVKASISITCIESEPESAEYGAFKLRFNSMQARFRIAKITPTKPGLFVSIWQRGIMGLTEPFQISDTPDLIIISTRKGSLIGQFVFPKDVLLEKGIISGNGKEGKRGIRVYPPWEKDLNKQATKTQEWQLKYFLDITIAETIDLVLAQRLFH